MLLFWIWEGWITASLNLCYWTRSFLVLLCFHIMIMLETRYWVAKASRCEVPQELNDKKEKKKIIIKDPQPMSSPHGASHNTANLAAVLCKLSALDPRLRAGPPSAATLPQHAQNGFGISHTFTWWGNFLSIASRAPLDHGIHSCHPTCCYLHKPWVLLNLRSIKTMTSALTNLQMWLWLMLVQLHTLLLELLGICR